MTMPSTIGVSMLETANIFCQNAWLRSSLCAARSTSCVRNANADPRSTIPISRRVKGIWREVPISAKARGNAVKSTVTERISQT